MTRIAVITGGNRGPVGHQRRITAEDEAAFLAQAGELNARIARILDTYG